MSEEEKKRPVGRPTEYKPEYCNLVVTHMGDGNTFRSFGPVVGVSHQCLYEWIDKHPEFGDAKKVAEDHCEWYWLKLGKAAASGQIENFNATAFVWLTKNILKWRDRSEVAHTGSDGGPIKLEGSVIKKLLQDDETIELIEKLSAKIDGVSKPKE